MKYNWDLRQIMKYRKQIKNSLKNTEDLTEEDSVLMKENIQMLNDMILCFIFNRNNWNGISFTKFIDSNKFLTSDTYQNYQKIPNRVKENILNASYKLNGLFDLYIPKGFPNINMNNEELIELCYEFFKWLPTNNKKYEKLFLEYTNPENHLLKFSKKDYNTFGTTYCLNYPLFKSFFSITRNRNIMDFLTLNHESSHGMFMSEDNSDSLYNNHFYLCELEGHFFEFLSIEFLKDKIDKSVINELYYTRFSDQFDRFTDLYITNLAISLFESNKNISIDTINEKMPFYIDKFMIKDALIQNPVLNSVYLFSYLTSLDLEEIYKFDPEYAFYLFEGIRNNKTNDVYTNLREHGIIFMDDDYESFQKTIKKINELGRV